MRLQLPGTRFQMGSRTLIATAIEPKALLKTVSQPQEWKPTADQATHGNRVRDKGHVAGIADYIESNQDYIFNSIMVYVKPSDVDFEPFPGWENKDIAPGILNIQFGAVADIGDGQHRAAGYQEVIRTAQLDDDLDDRLRKNGQAVIVVVDDDLARRAQDFVDLQRNAKPLSSSVGQSMDTRQEVNQLIMSLVRDPALHIFGKGARWVEFLGDTLGKRSEKLFAVKTIRYATGTALIGAAQRTTSGWENTVNQLISAQPDTSRATAMELWDGLSALPPFAEVIAGRSKPSELRERTYLTSGGVLYAIGFCAYLARTEHDLPTAEAMRRLAKVDFARPVHTDQTGRSATDAHGNLLFKTTNISEHDTVFVGNLVSPESGKIAAGRAAWEAAGRALLGRITG